MIQIANAPCSWGVLEFELEGEAAGYKQVLDEMVQSGYAGTELGDWGFMPTDPAELRKELTTRKLEMLGAFVPVAFKNENAHAKGAEVAVKTAKLMKDAGYENAFIVLADENGSIEERTFNAGRITPSMGLSDQEWQTYARGVEKVAQAVKDETGMRCVFHHHCGGYIETSEEIDKLLEMTNPELVGLVLDMGHYMFGGGDPLRALKKYAKRIWHIHFKDCHPGIAQESRKKGYDYFQSVNAGVFCELGKGGVDFPAITKELRNQHYHGWIVVEQDVLPGMGDPLECATRNREYIKTLEL